jgi:hypothetical protein
MALMQMTAKKVSEVVRKAELPVATVDAEFGERNGRAGVLVHTFYPLPEDEQIDKRVRMGKDTSGSPDGKDNSNVISSILSVYGRAEGVPLTYINEEDKERYGILDADGNQIVTNSNIFSRVKGPAAADEADPETTA